MPNRITGAAVTRTRRAWAARIAAGGVRCWECGREFAPDEPATAWDLGHFEDLAAGGPVDLAHTAPQCAGPNRAHGAALGNRARSRPRRRLNAWLEPVVTSLPPATPYPVALEHPPAPVAD